MNSKTKLYRLIGDGADISAVAKEARSVDGIISVGFFSDDVIEVAIEEYASEYDVFCALNEICEKHSVDLDDYEEVPAEQANEDAPAESDDVVATESGNDENSESTEPVPHTLKLPDEEKGWKSKYLFNFIEIGLSTVLLLLTMIFGFRGNAKSIMCLLAFTFVGYEIILDAAIDIYHKRFFSPSIVMALAAIATIFVADYTEAVVVALLFETEMTLSKVFTDINVDKLKKRFDYSYNEIPASEEDGGAVFAKDVRVGSLVEFKEGQIIAFDGTVESGNAVIDDYTCTGVHTSLKIKEGSEVLSGALIKSGEITLKTKNTVEESRAGKTYKKVSDGLTPFTDRVGKIMKIYIPACLAIALILCFVMPLFEVGGNLTYSYLLAKWAYIGVLFFAVSNLFTLNALQQIYVKSAVNRALSMGVFNVDSNVLHSFYDVKTALFSEPGALTFNGDIKVIAKKGQNGRINKLLAESFDSGELFESEFVDVGVASAGSYEALTERGIHVKPVDAEGSARYIVEGGEVIGAVVLNSGTKPDAYGAVMELRDAGVNSVAVAEGKCASAVNALKKVTVCSTGEYKTDDGTVCIGTAPNKNAKNNVVFASESEVANSHVAIPSGSVKHAVKTIKLAKRSVKSLKTDVIIYIVFKFCALILGILGAVISGANLLWISVIIAFIASAFGLTHALLNGREVY